MAGDAPVAIFLGHDVESCSRRAGPVLWTGGQGLADARKVFQVRQRGQY